MSAPSRRRAERAPDLVYGLGEQFHGCVCLLTSSHLLISLPSGQVIAYPLQLVRTRLQGSGLPGRPQYTGVADVVSRTVAADGMFGLYVFEIFCLVLVLAVIVSAVATHRYRGITANFAKGIPAVAISYLTFEESKKALSSLGAAR